MNCGVVVRLIWVVSSLSDVSAVFVVSFISCLLLYNVLAWLFHSVDVAVVACFFFICFDS